MKRNLIVAAIFAVLLLSLLLLGSRRGGNTSAPDISDVTTPPALAVTNSSNQSDVASPEPESGSGDAGSNAVATGKDPDQLEKAVRFYNQGHDTPVAFYGKVVDQDSNALQNVKVDLDVTEQYVDRFPNVTGTTTHLQRQTGADGRFEVTGLKGNFVTVGTLTKEGYEPEVMRSHQGEYGSRSGSFEEPIVFRMWSTNIHEPLITGAKSFVVTPDGRHYAIDLVKGTMAEGDEGDLVAWVKRPESVRRGQRYDWSCELAAPGGGLLEDSHFYMYTAPEAGYTNLFAHQEEAGVNGWGDGTGDKRFYLRLHNGEMYGRMTIGLFAYYNAQTPGLIRLSYAVNPSGSRLLR